MNRYFEVKKIVQGLKPVNTNVHVDIDEINLVIVCESPSGDEVEKCYPTVSSTGMRIFNHLVSAGMIDSIEKYSFDTNYQDFESNGVYLTNLVRYQADVGLKGNRSEKDKKVRELWQLTKDQLFSELNLIAENFPNTKVLFACGAAFSSQLKEVTTLLNSLDIDWFITSHPSRSKNELSNNYNPSFWNTSGIVKTKLMQNIEQYHFKRS